jgi:serine/threonine protein kinase/tetratricopeptide (TPR) repeat protein
VTDLLDTKISHYRIVQLLGAGGMGEVYRARDERLGRDVALKVLHAESMADATARARMIREAQVVSSLNHPHIAQVYDVGVDGDHVFIAMEMIEGKTLRDSIPLGGLAAESMLPIAVQIADALTYAHERGVIHRDLKTANIMLASNGWVNVLDFGLAKRLPSGDKDSGMRDTSLTAVGMVMGTPNHLPPEVLLGGQADARSDIWAFGVILYEMASGKFPFGGGSLLELAAAIVNTAPAPLSGRVPTGIQAIIGRCLAKDPAQRYGQASEVLAALEALARPTRLEGAGGIPRRVWIPAAAVAAVALVVGVAFGPGHLWDRLAGAGKPPRIGSLAVLPLANLSGDPEQEYFADGMTEELITDLAPIPSLKVISRTSVMRFKHSQQSLGEIAKALGVDAIVEGSVLRAGDRVRITAQLIDASSDHHLWAKSYERDFRDVLTLQSEVARDIAQEIRLQVTPQVSARLAKRRTVNPEAYELYLRGRFEWSKSSDEGVRKGIAYYERALAIDPADPRYSSGLADAYLLLVQVVGTIAPAEGMAKVKEYASRALAADENSAEGHASMAAGLFFGDWNWTESERHIRRAIELNPGYSTAHLIYSPLLAAAGRADEAIEQDRQALALDPFSMIILWNAGSTLYIARRYDEALAQVHRALEIYPRALLLEGSLVRIYEQKGDFPAALRVIDEFLPEQDGGKALAAKMRQGYATSGPAGYWRASLEYSLPRVTAVPGPAPRMAMFYTRVGERQRAIDWLERAYREHSGDMVFIKADPAFEVLHGDPRFEALVRRVGIP